MTSLLSCGGDPASFLSPRNISNTIGIPLRRSATAHGLDPARFSPHSLRPGGATALFIAGVPFEFIRRFGRWASMRLRDYIWHGDVLFMSLSPKLVLATGLIPHLQDANRLGPKRVRHSSVPSFSTGSNLSPPCPPALILFLMVVILLQMR